VDLSTFIVSVFCLIDDRLKGHRVRQRGPSPKLSDAEVLTIEIVGEFLGLDTDKGIYLFFRRHYAQWFPALSELHRTTFARQAANLWKVKEHLWQEFLSLAPHDPTFAICDSLPLPACLFARAYRCRRFRGEAAFGKDALLRQTFYGFRVHVRVCWPGVITRISVVPANTHELSIVPEITEGTLGCARRRSQLPFAKDQGGVGADGHRPSGSVLLQEKRSCPEKERLLESDSLPHRHGLQPTRGTLLCKAGVGARSLAFDESAAEEGALSHTVAFLLNHRLGNQPLQLAKLLH
jgi:hypothetical protein